MSSDTSGINISLLSPVSSPAPQAKQHTSTNLTGDPRRVKDLAADFSNLMGKWMDLNSEGMDIISRISNIKIEKVFNVEQEVEAGIVRLPQELNPLCDLLCDIVERMSTVEAKMQHKMKIAEGLESLQQFQISSEKHSILFSTMTLHDVVNTLKMILRDFDEELQLKMELCRQVAHADSRELLTFYCACWIHQPYIRPQSHDMLEALLIETGHVK